MWFIFVCLIAILILGLSLFYLWPPLPFFIVGGGLIVASVNIDDAQAIWILGIPGLIILAATVKFMMEWDDGF